MNSLLKVIQAEKGKGKSATKTQEGSDELAYRMTFNQSITQVMDGKCKICKTLFSLT